jgi:hypothetical protein
VPIGSQGLDFKNMLQLQQLLSVLGGCSVVAPAAFLCPGLWGWSERVAPECSCEMQPRRDVGCVDSLPAKCSRGTVLVVLTLCLMVMDACCAWKKVWPVADHHRCALCTLILSMYVYIFTLHTALRNTASHRVALCCAQNHNVECTASRTHDTTT